VGFGDSSLDFLLRVWIPRFEEGYATQSALAVAIHAALREAGIQIPFPQRDLHLRSVDAPAGIPPSADLPKK
jgi:small-conductance mechanosensitive channel